MKQRKAVGVPGYRHGLVDGGEEEENVTLVSYILDISSVKKQEEELLINYFYFLKN